ncbi:hypothetical protein [Intrasporangium sp. DVR]|uniref:hypothetical protein n=1 Tax=Intrasporangium sp. DVR TaxID=3127867 RepID=UPI00313A57EC
MTRKRAIAATAAAMALMAITTPTAAGANNALQGEFAGAVTYENCTVGAPEGPSIASGSWRINVHDAKGTARFVILVNDAPHVAFTAQLSRVWLDGQASFQGTVMTGAGPLLVTVKGEEMTYRIAPYDFTAWGGAKCDAITYHGTVTTD